MDMRVCIDGRTLDVLWKIASDGEGWCVSIKRRPRYILHVIGLNTARWRQFFSWFHVFFCLRNEMRNYACIVLAIKYTL